MSRQITDAELAELAERVKAGDAQAITAAVQATKPPRVGKVRGRSAVTDPARRTLLRVNTNVSKLVTQLQNARRQIAETPVPERYVSMELAQLQARIPGWYSDLANQAETLTHLVKSYFAR